MRLHQPSRDAQVGLDEAAVDAYRGAALLGDAEVGMGGLVAREVVLDTYVGEHPLVADQLGQLGALVGTVQAGRHQHRDRLARDASGQQGLDHGAQEQMVRHRPGDVADQDAGAAASASQHGQGRAVDRRSEGLGDGAGRIGQPAYLALAYHGRLRGGGHLDRQMPAAEGKVDPLHGLSLYRCRMVSRWRARPYTGRRPG